MVNENKPINELEEGLDLQLDFNKLAKAVSQSAEIIPVAVQNVDTQEVILVAYINKLAFDETVKTKIATFWSTSRNELWIKGMTSNNYFEVLEIRVNCEQNSVVYIVRPKGQSICHTKNSQGQARNCYYRRLNFETGKLENLDP